MIDTTLIPTMATAHTMQPFEPLLSADEAADHLRIHVKTLQKLAREERVPCVRMGKYWRFRLSSLDRWVAEQENQSSQPLRVEG
jgi:excisionase family DNA binding protein